MGGPPYTSKGCANCRKRRIKCDLGEPECARCKKKGILCPGYDPHRNFLYHTIVSRQERNEVALSSRPVAQLVSHLKPLALAPVFNTNAELRTQLFSTYMGVYFAPNNYLNGDDDSWYFLMSRFPNLAGESELFDRSIISLVSVYLGGKTGDANLARHGLELYNSGLKMLAQIIHRNRKPSLDILYATIVFSAYETMHGGGDALRNCFLHVQGVSAVLKQLDLGQCRDKDLVTSLLNRQKCCVTCFGFDPKFQRDVDWACLTLGLNKTPMDKTFDLLHECGALQIELAAILTHHQAPDRDSKCKRLLHHCLALDSGITFERLELDGFPSLCPRSDLACQPTLLPPDPSMKPYRFRALSNAKIFLLFWIARTVLRRCVYQAEKTINKCADATRMRQCAGEICRAVAFCMQPSNQMSSGHAVMVATSQASKCYIDCGDRDMFLWCQGVYSILQSHGLDIAGAMSQNDRGLWAMANGEIN
ncbi:Zn(II)2Cys6 transcription factor domain-containing protein [Aspergillus brunneoviolaceus CBS 621.78]|uniref:Uncharacterized protein n=1 Tax=Aspergillus brunneoviolaceus CBS 621.78 TaxID=1450534 RepID=A0ACD1GL49_9EURO|nr:hypothetical protein BO95DRAFT_404885 [Aspergillus brunneoviolaceus CBS 621.78]RAH49970.1 hypothetical protein BO95DRAFT_404885 [Aspergillus brunneoviolaceus CBS 621.78]